MVKVRSFKGFLPVPELAQKLLAYPYDVVESDEARKIAEGNEICFHYVNKPEIDLPEDIDPYSDKVYQKGKENLDKFISKGWLEQEKVPIMYVYAQKLLNNLQYGIVLESSVAEYENNIIKKHELTRKKKEEDRTKLTEIQNANSGPVFLAYKDHAGIGEIVQKVVSEKPYIDVIKEDNIQHTLWKCTPDQSLEIQKLFEEVPFFYIADGHHRSASAYNVGAARRDKAKALGKEITGQEDFNWFMSLAYPCSQLHILDYNRVLKDYNGKTVEEIFKEIEKSFTIRKLDKGESPKPKAKGHYSFLIELEWYEVIIRPELVDNTDPVKSLDVELLTNYCLTPIFGIKDLRNDERIDFVGGMRGIPELELRCKKDCKIAIAVYPIQIDELFKVADAGLIMPPKSTWFEPKPRDGMVVRVMNE